MYSDINILLLQRHPKKPPYPLGFNSYSQKAIFEITTILGTH